VAARDLLLFLSLALIVTWPLALQFASAAPGAEKWQGDIVFFETPVNLWNLWWFRHATVDLGQSPFTGTQTFYPAGANLWLHTLAPLPAALAIPLQSVMTLTATYNTLVLAALCFAGLAAAALARELGQPPGAARVAGAIYMCAPVVMARLYAGHFELLWIGWIPLALLLFLRLLRADRPGWRDPVLLGLTIAAAAYTSAYYAVYAVEALVLAAILFWRALIDVRRSTRLAAAAAIALACVAPMLIQIRAAEADITTPNETKTDFRDLALEPLALVVPSFMHPLLGPSFVATQRELNGTRGLPQEATGTLGLTVIALAIAALVLGRRSRQPAPDLRLPLALTLTFLVLSFGAEFKWRGTGTQYSLPAALLTDVPVVRLARAPNRHVVVAMIGLAILAAAGWQRMTRRRALAAAALLLVAFEYWPQVPLFTTRVPEVYHRLAREPGRFAVLDIPLGVRDGRRWLGEPDAKDLLAQTVHQHPIVGGMASRLGDDRWMALARAPLIGALLGADPRSSMLTRTQVTDYFRRWQIQAIVIHPTAHARERAAIEYFLPIGSRERFADGTELWWVD
jgi:hypothetical protein